jgi:EAL domain-containing protein (putative c-di-GMP-specific phosphodiesterase class I)
VAAASLQNVGIPLWINVSSDQLVSREIRANLERILRDHDCVIEWTERHDEESVAIAGEILRSWRHDGITIAIDDIGHGSDGLGRLIATQAQIAKIDRSILMASQQGESIALVALNRFLMDFGARAVLEGIESTVGLTLAKGAGITLGQGYLLGRPAVFERNTQL